MENFDELLKKSHKWREWYYGGEPKLGPVADSVEEAFDLINATLFGHRFSDLVFYRLFPDLDYHFGSIL